jgi:hypothetical protein
VSDARTIRTNFRCNYANHKDLVVARIVLRRDIDDNEQTEILRAI